MEKPNTFGRNENVALNSGTFAKYAGKGYAGRMTIRGAVNRSAILLAIVVATAGASWISFSRITALGELAIWQSLAAVAAFIFGLTICLKHDMAPTLAPVYAGLQGVFLGGISAVFEGFYPGLVLKAVTLTFGTLAGMLFIYKASGFHVTAKFRTGVLAATFGILIVYLADLLLHLLGAVEVPFVHETGWMGIAFSLYVVLIAAINLVLDFDLIEAGAREGAPRYMEWYSAFGLLVTLIWLYLEVLKLLARMAASTEDE